MSWNAGRFGCWISARDSPLCQNTGIHVCRISSGNKSAATAFATFTTFIATFNLLLAVEFHVCSAGVFIDSATVLVITVISQWTCQLLTRAPGDGWPANNGLAVPANLLPLPSNCRSLNLRVPWYLIYGTLRNVRDCIVKVCLPQEPSIRADSLIQCHNCYLLTASPTLPHWL